MNHSEEMMSWIKARTEMSVSLSGPFCFAAVSCRKRPDGLNGAGIASDLFHEFRGRKGRTDPPDIKIRPFNQRVFRRFLDCAVHGDSQSADPDLHESHGSGPSDKELKQKIIGIDKKRAKFRVDASQDPLFCCRSDLKI